MSTYYGPADMVNSPPHYQTDYGLEAITVIEAFKLDYLVGSAVAYQLRAGKKGSELEDLRKARWYLDRKIAHLEGRGTGATPPPPAAMQAPGSYSNRGMDEARQQQLDNNFRFGQSVEPARLVPRQICPADDVTRGEEEGTFISRNYPPVSNA